MTPGLVERAVGQPVILRVAGRKLAPGAVGPLTIRHGRSSVDERPAAATLSVQLHAAQLQAWPEVGDRVDVTLTDAAAGLFGVPLTNAAQRRFAGRVTDVTVSPHDELHGPAVVRLVATGYRARLGVLDVGDVPWPNELDGARAARVLAAAAALDPQLMIAPPAEQAPGAVLVLGRDVDRQPALRLLDELAEHSGGELVERRDGSLAWRDASSRAGAPVAAVLTARDVLRPTVWTTGLRGMVNAVTVAYGTVPAGGSQAEVSAADPVAQARHGRLDARVPTQLVDAAAALARATELVGRRGRPRYAPSALLVELIRGVPRALAGQLLGLEQGALVQLVGWPSTGPQSAAFVWVEGWTETLTRDGWSLALDAVSYGSAAPPRSWAQLPTTGDEQLLHPDGRGYLSALYWSTSGPSGATYHYDADLDLGGGKARRVQLGATTGTITHNGALSTAPYGWVPIPGGTVLRLRWDVEGPPGATVRPFVYWRRATTVSQVFTAVTIPASGRLVVDELLPAATADTTGVSPGIQVYGAGLVPYSSVLFRSPSLLRVPGRGPTWHGADAVSWLGAVGWELPPTDAGRWLDTPADRRWSTAAGTWTAYTTHGS